MTYRLYQQPNRPHRLRIWILLGLFIGGFGSGSLGLAASPAEAKPLPPPVTPLLISEIQTGGCSDTPCVESSKEDARQEFIELYNMSDAALQLTDWKLQYVSSSGATVTDLQTIAGQIEPRSYFLLAHAGYFTEDADLTFGSGNDGGKLAKSGGHVQLADSSGTVVDRVSWGSAEQAWGKPAPALAAGQSLERQTAGNTLSNEGDNFHDFAIQSTPTPQSGGFTVNEPEVPDTPALTCEGIVISELLPNPAGADGGHEYIELYNPTNEVINLAGCSLKTSSGSTMYDFADTSLQPGEYHAISDAVSGLTLPNSSGGSVWLLSPTDELQAVTYPGDLEDDTAWILNGGVWVISYTATPGSANMLTPIKPCPEGQTRNVETNRCVTESEGENQSSSESGSSATSTLKPCDPGQVRNPETNRCRSTASAANTPAACKEGQERNPETNRCRNLPSATGSKPCPEGQERNPETNRCRKIAAGGAANGSGGGSGGVQDIAATSASPGKPYWVIALVLVLGGLGYAAYEWRQEALEFVRSRFVKAKPAVVKA